MRRLALLALGVAGLARADVDTLSLAEEWHVRGGMVAAATCVLNAPAPDGPDGGTIDLRGVPPGAEILDARVYWSVVSDLAPVPPGSPTFDGVPLVPRLVGEIAATPCFDEWQSRTAVFAADVTPLVTGDGAHALDGFPFVVEESFTEGATLVVVHCDPRSPPRHLLLWEGIDVTRPDPPERLSFRQALGGFVAAGPDPVPATLLVVAGNGQGRPDMPDTDLDPLLFEGFDFDRADRSILSGGLCPGERLGLYDLTLLDVTGLLPAGATSATLELDVAGDCHSVGAVLLQVPDGSPGAAREPSALDARPDAEPLRVVKEGARLRMSWEPAGGPWHVHSGAIGTWYSHGAAACGLAVPTVTIDSGSGDRYYLAVSEACGSAESSYGRDSFRRERPSTRDLGTASCP